MGKNRFTIQLLEIIEEAFKLRFGKEYDTLTDDSEEWNTLCDEIYFDGEESSETWEIDEINQILKDNPNNIKFVILKKLMGKKKEVLVIRD